MRNRFCIVCNKQLNNFYSSHCAQHRVRPSGLKYEKHKENPSNFVKGYLPWNKGVRGYLAGEKHYRYGKKVSDEIREKIRETKKQQVNKEFLKKIGLKGLMKQQNLYPTSIEKALYDYLVLNGIVFERQKLINGKFLVDAYVPSFNLVIEADGTYWHSLERVKKRDKAKNAYLKKCGYNLVRLSDTNILDRNFTQIQEFSLRGGDIK